MIRQKVGDKIQGNNPRNRFETGDGKINLAMGAIERENGTISLVSSHNLGDRQGTSLSDCI